MSEGMRYKIASRLHFIDRNIVPRENHISLMQAKEKLSYQPYAWTFMQAKILNNLNVCNFMSTANSFHIEQKYFLL